ncbi:MAG: VOC family protein, partial [Actinomycetota bacterium]|nr:VOC family protein [Actinomycetota bacterium]
MLDHVGFEVADLERSAVFYDAVFYALGTRRAHQSSHAIAYGDNRPSFWIVQRGRAPAPGYGHVALKASGKAAVQ